MEQLADFQDLDDARPSKRVRLEAPLNITEETQEEIVDDDDWDDIYGATAESVVDAGPVETVEETLRSVQESEEHPSTTLSPITDTQFIPLIGTGEQLPADALDEASSTAKGEGGVPVDAIQGEDGLLLEERPITTADERSAMILEETSRTESGSPHKLESLHDGGLSGKDEENEYQDDSRDVVQASEGADLPSEEVTREGTELAEEMNGYSPNAMPKVVEDAEFLEAAAAQKDNEKAEWQFDSSDAESSDSDSDSSSNADSDEAESGSEGGYEMLDPATAAKLLMSGDGDEDDEDRGKGKSGADYQPRTANEVKEEVVPKPDVVVTDDMRITYLGTVDRTVDNLLLIKAVTPGEYQVLDHGSVLCTERREVVGAVTDTFGRVQEPIYSVAFTNAKEIEDAGYEYGTRIFYVDSHSSFVFTQPLKSVKGTDASNIHDEEVGEDEIEFSDDEKEAEFKRMKKAAKREGRGGLSRGAFNEEKAGRSFVPGWVNDKGGSFTNVSDAPQQQYGGGMSYDDGDVQEEFYSPLKRPDNLSQLMQGGGPPRPQRGFSERGRGRGRGDRGRGRGDRGRGRGGFDQRSQRGGRGGYGQDRDRGGYGQQNGHRGNAHSFPDRHNDHKASSPKQHALPPKPNAPQASPPLQQQYAAYQQHSTQQASSPQTYQFNGYQFQYGNPPPQPPTAQASYYNHAAQPQAHSPGGSFPAGSYVNPAFFQNRQQQQWTPLQQQQQPTYIAWQSQPHQNNQAPYGASTSPGGNYQQPQQQQNNNLADILRQFGGPQR